MAPQSPQNSTHAGMPLEYEQVPAASHAPGIPMEGMVPADKLAAPATHSTTALRSYIPALDGVRGLAIIAVLFCHFVWFTPAEDNLPPPDGFARLVVEGFKTGRYGVDLFFVLSGFLITGILVDAKSDKHYFRNFYARRTLRIFPLYYSTLLFMFVILPLFVNFDSAGDQRIIHNQGWMWFYLSNMRSAFTGPEMWQQDRLWMGHFWSLSIEEQFYLVWPMVILLLSRRQAMGACIGLMLGAPLVRLALYISLDYYPQGLYAALYFTLCKLDTLALGAFLALAARSPGGLVGFARFAPWTLALTGALLAPMLVLKWDKDTFVGAICESAKLSIICFFCGSLLVLAVSSTSRQLFGWFFTLRIMRFFGKYSYAMYIFHELITPFLLGGLSAQSIAWALGVHNWYLATALHIAVGFAITTALALTSWNVLEKHMLKLKRFFEHAAPKPAPGAAKPVAAPVAVAATSG